MIPQPDRPFHLLLLDTCASWPPLYMPVPSCPLQGHSHGGEGPSPCMTSSCSLPKTLTTSAKTLCQMRSHSEGHMHLGRHYSVTTEGIWVHVVTGAPLQVRCNHHYLLKRGEEFTRAVIWTQTHFWRKVLSRFNFFKTHSIIQIPYFFLHFLQNKSFSLKYLNIWAKDGCYFHLHLFNAWQGSGDSVCDVPDAGLVCLCLFMISHPKDL